MSSIKRTASELAAELREFGLLTKFDDEGRMWTAQAMANEAAAELERLVGVVERQHDNMLRMQADQLESDKGALMFIAALVRRFGADHEGGKLVVLSDLEMLLGSEGELHRANPAEGGVRLLHQMLTEEEAAMRKAFAETKASLPPVSPFKASLELAPDHIITGEAAVARGTRMLNANATPGESA